MAPRPVSRGGSALNEDAEIPHEALIAASSPPSPISTSLHENRTVHWPTGHLVPRNDTSGDNSTDKRPPFCNSCLVQDNDLRLVYRGKWLLNGTSFQTTHSTTDRGAKVSFQFRGSKIIVFGTVPVSNETVAPPTAKYIISGRPPVEFKVPMANMPIRNQPFFQAAGLDRSQHRLSIEVINVRDGAPYILQHLFVEPHRNRSSSDIAEGDTADDENPDNSSSTTILRPTVNPMTTDYDPGIETSPSIPWEDPAPTEPSAELSSMTIKVLSGLLGGLLAVIVIATALFLIRKRQMRKSASSRFFSKFWKYSPRPDTIYTSFTTPDSIQRNEPSFLMRGSSAFTRSEIGPPSDLRVSTVNPSIRLSYPNTVLTPVTRYDTDSYNIRM